MKNTNFRTLCVALIQFSLCFQIMFATSYYVDSQIGSDGNDGITPETAWKTIDRVNMVSQNPGDSFLFKRGGVFRGVLLPKSGALTSYITYGAYGEESAAKPKLLASFQRNDPLDWQSEGSNLWSTGFKDASLSGEEKLNNPSFETNSNNWILYTNPNNLLIAGSLTRSMVANEYFDAIGGGGKITCANNGNVTTDIQFNSHGFDIKAATWYKLSFHAKSSSNFSAPIVLIKNGSPYTNYILLSSASSIQFTSGGWYSYDVYFQTNYTTDITNSADKARITLQLGNVIPDGGSLLLDAYSFQECVTPQEYLSGDIGNIILGNETSCGIKVWNRVDLNVESEYWFDANLKRLYFYTTNGNPATFYTKLELSTPNANVSATAKSYIIIENLDLRYGGGGGIGFQGYGNGVTFAYPKNIIIRNVDISFVGGTKLSGTTRAGNGIGFWNGAREIIVEGCRISQVYDSGISPQGDLNGHVCQNFYFRNNIFDKCEQSFEMWQRGTSTLTNVYFENNTCMNSGFGWSHSQRPDPNGVHLLFWGFASTVNVSNIYIRNNVFFNASNYGIYSHWADDINKIDFDYNCWYPGSYKPILWINYPVGSSVKEPRAYDWISYRSVFSNDSHSILVNPQLNLDGSLASSSPCRDNGLKISTVTNDANIVARPQGTGYDIGAFEYLIPNGVNSVVNEVLKVTIYPNPATDYFSIKLENNPHTPIQLLLIGLNGKVIQTKIISNAGDVRFNFMQKTRPGYYLLKVIGVEFSKTIPVMIL